MSLAAASNGAPEAKKFRFSLPTQVVVKHALFDMNQNQGENGGNSNGVSQPTASSSSDDYANGCGPAEDTPGSGHKSPAALPNEIDERPNDDTNGVALKSAPKEEVLSASNSPTVAEPKDELQPDGALFRDSISAFLASALFKNLQSEEPKQKPRSTSANVAAAPPASQHTMHAPIPGALAVAASPAAQLFPEDDWSWHRNPAAAIRSGGTNKQTPVWKYFVYNKAENLSRCIIGDCTYVLKGPHTSTLACHLKKHPAEYAEFQRLKVDYTRERSLGTVSNPSQRNGRASSAASTGSSNSMNGQPSTASANSGGSFTSNTPAPTVSNTTSCTSATHSQRSGSSTPSGMSALLKKQMEPSNGPFSGIFGPNSLYSAAALSGTAAALGPKQSVQQSPQNTPSAKNPINQMSEFLSKLQSQVAPSMFPNALGHAPFNPPALPVSLQNALNGSPVITPTGTPTSESAAANQWANRPEVVQWKNLMMKNAGIFGAELAKSNANSTVSPNRKWPPQDRKQREVEGKLALMLCSSQLPLNVLRDPFFRDFMETLQPKFQLPTDEHPIEQMLNGMHKNILANIKQTLTPTAKFTLLVDVVPIGEAGGRHVVCVSAAYFASVQQAIKVVLLGVRKIEKSETAKEELNVVVSKVLAGFSLSLEQVNRSIVNGLELLGIDEKADVFPRQLRSYRRLLEETFKEAVDSFESFGDLRSSVRSMVESFCFSPESTAQFARMSNGLVTPSTNLSDIPFDRLAAVLMEQREPFVVCCAQLAALHPIAHISDTQWALLENFVRLQRLLASRLDVVQEGSYVTLDQVVPSIMQLLVSLEKEFPFLDALSSELSARIREKLAFILDPTAADFDTAFIQATALNPQLLVLLDEAQMNEAKSRIEKALSDRLRTAEEAPNRRSGMKASGLDSLLALVEQKAATSPNNKSPAFSSSTSSTESAGGSSSEEPSATSALYPDLVQTANQRRKLLKERQQSGNAEAIVHAYFDDVISNNALSKDFPSRPLAFWHANAARFPQLSELAIELLSVPSSTIPPEQTLSSFREQGAARNSFDFIKAARNLNTLERDAIVRFNRDFADKFL